MAGVTGIGLVNLVMNWFCLASEGKGLVISNRAKSGVRGGKR